MFALRKQFKATPSGGVWNSGRQVKPSGKVRVDQGHRLAQNLFLYAYSKEGKEYHNLVDSFPGHAWYPPLFKPGYPYLPDDGGKSANAYYHTGIKPTRTVTAQHGSGVYWPGVAIEQFGNLSLSIAPPQFMFTYLWDTAPIRTVVDLYNRGAGAAYSIATGFVSEVDTVGSATPGHIFGRPAWGYETAPQSAGSLVAYSDGTNRHFEFWYSTHNGGTPALGTTGTSYPLASATGALNKYHTMVATASNVSAGSATIKLYLDGILVATSTGVQAADSGGNQNDESQIMFGNAFHDGACHSSQCFQGFIPWGAYWTRALNASEALELHQNPYGFIQPLI